MKELSYQKKKNYGPDIVAFIGLLIVLIFYISYSTKSSRSSTVLTTSHSLLSKEENLLSYQEWEEISRIRANEFYECAKDLGMDISSMASFETCAIQYNNGWVKFSAGLDEKSNLNSEDISKLKDYWNKSRSEMTKKWVI